MVGDPAPITQSAEEKPGKKGSGTISQISGAALATGRRPRWEEAEAGQVGRLLKSMRWREKHDSIFAYFGIKKEKKREGGRERGSCNRFKRSRPAIRSDLTVKEGV